MSEQPGSAEAVETYEPLEPEPAGPPVEPPPTSEEVELDARAPSVMPIVWVVLAICAVALCLGFVVMAVAPPHKTPVFQASAPPSQSAS